ncbi:MAG: hypothetical protein WB696_31690 [Chthoniobacterales bacterium]
MKIEVYTDDTPVNLTELAVAMRVSRATVSRWRAAGYELEFGYRTTVAHCKEWLRSVYAPMITAERNKRRIEMVQFLDRLR